MNNQSTNYFSSIPEAIEEFKKGNMVIVVDNPQRENQGDVIFPAESVSTEKINFLIKECRGLVCAPITLKHASQLDIPLMIDPTQNTEKLKCNFTVSIDAKEVTSFGISASDRALTITKLIDPKSTKTDFDRPGHIFPIIAKDGGVLERNGHTEAAVDLCRLSGIQPTGVLCEVLRDDGETARLPDLKKFSKKFNIKMITIDELIEYVKAHPESTRVKTSIATKLASSSLPTFFGKFQISIYKSIESNQEHAVLTTGNLKKKPVLTRIHSQCLTGDTLLSLRCDCREQLHQAMQVIAQRGSGVILYLNQEGRGIGLANKIKAYALQEQNMDTVDANRALGLPDDARDYKIAAEILQDLGISEINLLTNNPGKIKGLERYGIKIAKRIPIEIKAQTHNSKYLAVKKAKLGHLLTDV